MFPMMFSNDVVNPIMYPSMFSIECNTIWAIRNDILAMVDKVLTICDISLAIATTSGLWKT